MTGLQFFRREIRRLSLKGLCYCDLNELNSEGGIKVSFQYYRETYKLKKGTKRSASVSQIVRDYAEKNPGLGPTQISKDLTAQGHKVYPALVSQALGKTGKKRKKKAVAKRGRKPRVVKSSPAADLSLLHLKAVSDFVKSSGSAEKAIASIKTYQKLSEMFQ